MALVLFSKTRESETEQKQKENKKKKNKVAEMTVMPGQALPK
jgi:hypothetical protein